MKLTIKELAPYLPYDVNALCIRTNEVRKVTLLHFTYDLKTVGHNHLLYDGLLLEHHKLILRPLSDLTKELYWELSKKDPNKSFGFWYGKYEGNNDKRDFIHYEGYSSRNYFLIDGYEQFSYKMMLFFFENHYDVFGLIEKGLAINLNDIK